MWVTITVAVLGCGGWITTIVIALLNRRWKKQDEAKTISPERIDKIETKLDALVKCQKVMSVSRIHHLGLSYIDAGSITLEEKETLHEMHDAYEALGGNGHLDAIMKEVDRLQVVRSRPIKREAE